MSKQDKRKQQRDIAKNKKNAILDRKRFGTLEGAPKIVVRKFIKYLLISVFHCINLS